MPVNPGVTTISAIENITRVRNVVDGTLSLVTRVDRVFNIIDGTISSVPRVDRVFNLVDGTLTTVTGIDRVRNIVDGTISTVTGITNTVKVSAPDGTFAVYFSPNRPTVLADQQSTSGIFTVSGTTSTTGNNTLVSPSASYNFKVFAYAIQTTGIVSAAPRFTTGASAGATELWRPLITPAVSTSAPVGANFGVMPPGFIFATGTNTTLSLYLDTGSLIHYSVSYIKESA